MSGDVAQIAVEEAGDFDNSTTEIGFESNFKDRGDDVDDNNNNNNNNNDNNNDNNNNDNNDNNRSSNNNNTATKKDNAFTFTLSDPSLEGKLPNTYVSYSLTTKKLSSSTNQSEILSVRRRYNDFYWLRQRLNELHPMCIIPCLPDKLVFNRYTDAVILERQRELCRFLDMIANHPVLSLQSEFDLFISADRDNLEKFMNDLKKNSSQPFFSKMFSSITDSLTQSVQWSAVEEIEPKYENYRTYALNLSRLLEALKVNHDKLMKSYNDYNTKLSNDVLLSVKELSNFNFNLSDNNNNDSDKRDSITTIPTNNTNQDNGKTSESNNTTVTKTNLELLIKAIQDFSQATTDLVDSSNANLEPIWAYIRLAQSLEGALKARQQLLLTKQNTEKTLESKKQQQQQQNAKIEKEINELKVKSEAANESYLKAKTILDGELARFDEEKNEIWTKRIAEYIDVHKNFHTRKLNTWQAILSTFPIQEEPKEQ